jgi:hypothetical protein
MPPRQDFSALPFDRSMRPRYGDRSDGQKRRKSNPNDQEEEGENVATFPRPDERSLAPNPRLLSGSGDGQNPTLTDEQGLLQRIRQLQFVEQQRLRALNQHLMLAVHQGLATGQRDPRLSVLVGAPTFLGSHPTSPSLTSSDAAAVAALFARRRVEQEDEILFNRQLVAMDATRWEQLIAGRNLSNRTSGSIGGIPGSELGGVPNIRANRLDDNSLFSGYYASILEATRRASMPTLAGPTASAHLHRSSLPLPHGSWPLEMSRAPIVERRGPLTLEKSQSSVAERCDGSGSTKTNPASNDEKSAASPQSVIGHLIERYTSGGTKEASFPLKLHAILVNPEFHDFICWLPHGLSWRIIRMSKFEVEVIPRHFRHTKYASFMRQGEFYIPGFFLMDVSLVVTSPNAISPRSVNGWDFSRNPIEANSYSHPLFVRDDPARCLNMVRFGATKNAAGLSVKPKEKAKGKTEVQEPNDGGPKGKGRHKM